MKLYHGSNMIIDTIDLSRGRRGKDFGQGFYLSEDEQQALLMAERTVEREGCGSPSLTIYEFDESALDSLDLKTLRFEGYTEEWAHFILSNRQNKTANPVHDYDIVYGPIADDKVGLQISRYQMRYIPIGELIRQLAFVRPTFQYFFGTSRALNLLKRI